MIGMIRCSWNSIARGTLIVFYLGLSALCIHAQQSNPDSTGGGTGNSAGQTPALMPTNCSNPTAVFDPSCAGVLSNQSTGVPSDSSRSTDGQYKFDFSSEERQDRLLAPPSMETAPTPPLQHAPLPPEASTEFQKFVESSTGKMLPLYGSQLFGDVPSTFAPIDQAPVTSDYVIGPGDELLLRAWGSITFNLRRTVDRNGYIYIPNVGQLQVSGLRFTDARDFIAAQIGRVFQRFQVSVEMGHLRSVQIFIVGKARRPGTYTVSSLSTVVNAIFVAGGPTSSGSMRRIQLKRNSQTIAEVDLYNLLLKGDKSSDVAILPGDVIYIPPAGPRVALTGSVNEPAIYETKPGETVGSLLEMEGGLTSLATEQSAELERFEDQNGRHVMDIRLDAAGRETKLHDGDVLWVRALVPQYKDAVTLRGNVANPGRYAWHTGMRIRDLIPNKEMLITRQYWQQYNKLGLPSAESRSESSENKPAPMSSPANTDMRTDTMQNDISHENNSSQHIANIAASSIYHDDRNSSINKASVAGLSARSHVGTPVAAIDWDYAVIERLDKETLTSSLIPFHLGRLLLQGDDTENIELRPGDIITIFSQADVLVPQERQRKLVRLEGEFEASGVYSVHPGETLRQLVARAGGFTPQAYLYGSSFTRESTRLQQQARLDDYVTHLEEDIQRSAANRSSTVITPAEAAVTTATLESQKTLVSKLRQLRATGRIVLGMGARARSLDEIPDIPLEDGDAFIVPSVPSNVSVIGAVYDQNSFLYKPSSETNDYLDLAGGFTRNADDGHMFVIHADGSVVSRNSHPRRHGPLNTAKLNPGDAIVVPEKINKSTLLRGLTDWSSIFSQFALGAAAVNVIR